MFIYLARISTNMSLVMTCSLLSSLANSNNNNINGERSFFIICKYAVKGIFCLYSSNLLANYYMFNV